jgi:hypothetical protein
LTQEEIKKIRQRQQFILAHYDFVGWKREPLTHKQWKYKRKKRKAANQVRKRNWR